MKRALMAIGFLFGSSSFADIQIQPGGSVIVNENQKMKVVCVGTSAPRPVNCIFGRDSQGRPAIFNIQRELIYVPFNGNFDATKDRAAELVQAGICRF